VILGVAGYVTYADVNMSSIRKRRLVHATIVLLVESTVVGLVVMGAMLL